MKSNFQFGPATGAQARAARMICLGALALLFAGCRMDMHEQPKYLPYEPTTFFDDGRSERPVVPGTVARGQLRLDELLYTGKENGVRLEQVSHSPSRAKISNAAASATTSIARPATITPAAAGASWCSADFRRRLPITWIACARRPSDISST